MNSADYIAIERLITQADQYANERNALQYVSLFVEQGQIMGKMGSVIGREKMITFTDSVWGGEPDDVHLTSSILVKKIEEKKATATSMLTIVEKKNLSIRSMNQITHKLVKIGERWYFESRQIS